MLERQRLINDIQAGSLFRTIPLLIFMIQPMQELREFFQRKYLIDAQMNITTAKAVCISHCHWHRRRYLF